MLPSGLLSEAFAILLLVGAVIGLSVAGLIGFGCWLWRHIDIVWIP